MEQDFNGVVLRGDHQGSVYKSKSPFLTILNKPKIQPYIPDQSPTSRAVEDLSREYIWSRDEHGWVPIDDPHENVSISVFELKDRDGFEIQAKTQDGRRFTRFVSRREYHRLSEDKQMRFRFIAQLKEEALEYGKP